MELGFLWLGIALGIGIGSLIWMGVYINKN